jgi:hypothetical protein
MAKNSKIEVAAINIRINKESKRDYELLIAKLAKFRRGVRVRGDTHVAITSYDPKDNTGTISKYTEIDLDGDWFDQERFNAATPAQLAEINIPPHLKPNFSSFYFKLDPALHVVAFTSYAAKKGLSALAVETYFRGALAWEEINREFGRVEADVIKDYEAVELILDLPHLKELEIIIRPPNADDINGALAEAIEENLREQNVDEYQQVLRAKGKKNIKANDQTRALAAVAAENGSVKGKNLEKGVKVPYTTADKPLTEFQMHGKDAYELGIFRILADKVFKIIAGKRREQKKGDLFS